MKSAAIRIDPKTNLFRTDYAANGADLPGAGLGWLSARRVAAMEAFGAVGVPHRRIEAWKYTDLANALDAGLEPATPFRGAGEYKDAFNTGAARIDVVSGFVQSVPEASDIEILDLAKISPDAPAWVKDYLGKLASAGDQPVGALSLGLMRGGIALRVAADAKPSPLHLAFFNPSRGAALASHTRVLVVVEEGAKLTLLESHTGEADGADQILANLGIEIVLKANARLEHIRLQREGSATVHMASLGATIADGARYDALTVELGARMARLDMNIRLEAPTAEAHLNGVIAGGSAHTDITTVMDHAAGHTQSRQLFKSVLGGKARSVTQGKVIVREGALKSDSHQLFKALLLSPRAEADAKPELEIYADDVICGHGTAIGALDADSLFYLRARGIPEHEARNLLVRAFLDDAMTDFGDEAVHDALWRHLEAVLPAVEAAEATP